MGGKFLVISLVLTASWALTAVPDPFFHFSYAGRYLLMIHFDFRHLPY